MTELLSSERHATLRSKDRVVIVGDIHGCVRELKELLALHTRPGDTLIFAGDLVNKGPNSAEVLSIARTKGALGVIGNHELAVLRAHRDGFGEDKRFAWVQELSRQDVEYLRELPLTIHIPAHESLVVHAGLVPGLSLEQQSVRDMTHMRDVVEEEEDGDDDVCYRALESPTGQPWAECWSGDGHRKFVSDLGIEGGSLLHVYFGHDAKRGLQQYRHATGLDTGCLYGGELTAAILKVGEPTRMVSVKAKQQYVIPADQLPRHASWSPRWKLLGVGCGLVGVYMAWRQLRDRGPSLDAS